MIRQYIDEALHRASYSVIDGNMYCATVTGLPGVIATGATFKTCRDHLAEIVEEWVLLRVSRGLSVPRLGSARVQVRRVRR
jgi:predicted RNase H-like HicB family nuclease